MDQPISSRVWSSAFGTLCSAMAELSLPALSMVHSLPVTASAGFMAQLQRIDSVHLSKQVAQQRGYLQRIARQWACDRASDSSWPRCVAASSFNPAAYKLAAALPDSVLVISGTPPPAAAGAGNISLEAAPVPCLDVAGAAPRLAAVLGRLLPDWRALPWLGDGSAGVVLAGGAVQSALFTADTAPVFGDLDLFVIAADAEAYERVIKDVREAIAELPLHERRGRAAKDVLARFGPDPGREGWTWTAADGTTEVQLIRFPYCSPAALVKTFDMPSVAAFFDGAAVYLDDRAAWCHANRLILADPIFDRNRTALWPARLLKHAGRLPGYKLLLPGPFGTSDYAHISGGLSLLLNSFLKQGWSHERLLSGVQSYFQVELANASFARFALLHAAVQVLGSGIDVPGTIIASCRDKYATVRLASKLRAPPARLYAEAVATVDRGGIFLGFFQDDPWAGHADGDVHGWWYDSNVGELAVHMQEMLMHAAFAGEEDWSD